MADMNKEQYEYIKSLGGRKALYPLEVARIFNIYREIGTWGEPGCESCSENARFVIEKVYTLYNSINPEQFQEPKSENKEQENKPEQEQGETKSKKNKKK